METHTQTINKSEFVAVLKKPLAYLLKQLDSVNLDDDVELNLSQLNQLCSDCSIGRKLCDELYEIIGRVKATPEYPNINYGLRKTYEDL